MHNILKATLLGATMMTGATAALAQDASMPLSDNVSSNPELTTFVAAAQAAGLSDLMLMGDPSYTIFAPSNAAFAALDNGVLDSLLLPENIEQLTGLLTGHIVLGTYTTDDFNSAIVAGESINAADTNMVVADQAAYVRTLGNTYLFVRDQGSALVVNAELTETEVTQDYANIVSADLASANGVVHVVDTVLMPTD